jgi:hypothetical protein
MSRARGYVRLRCGRLPGQIAGLLCEPGPDAHAISCETRRGRELSSRPQKTS